MFHIFDRIFRFCGEVPRISFQPDGPVLVQVGTPNQKTQPKKLSMLANASISCNARVVIYCKDLLRYSEEKFLEKLSNQGVIRVKRIKKFNVFLSPIPFLIISFRTQVLPPSLRAAWLRLLICSYRPLLQRFFYCQFFGHVGRNCRQQAEGFPAICERWGATHGPECTSKISNEPTVKTHIPHHLKHVTGIYLRRR